MSDSDQIAAFLATRGATRVDAGVSTMSRNALYRAIRAETEQDAINERHVVVDHCGREHVRNGMGEWLS